jgi:hypothetical protein
VRLPGWAIGFGVTALGAAVALFFARDRFALIVHIYVVVVSAGALSLLSLALTRSLRASAPSGFERALRRSPDPAPARIQQLERLEREVALGRQSAWDLHARLRGTLRETAAGLLAVRRGIDLDRDPRAQDVLGAEAWELVRPDRPPPGDRHAGGADREQVERTLTALETL